MIAKILSLFTAVLCICSFSFAETISPAELGSFKTAKTPGVNNRKNCKASHTAFEVSRNDVTFYWTPAKRPDSVLGEAALADAVISTDGSLMIIAENYGSSTRLVFFNLLSRKICNGFSFPGRKIVKLSFIPGQQHLAAALQRNSETTSILLYIDLRSGNVIAEHKISGTVSDFTCSSSELFFTCGYRIGKISLSNFFASPVDAMQTNPAGGLLALSIDGKVLARVITGKVEFYELSSNGLIPMNEVSMPSYQRFEWVIPALPDNTSLLLGRKQGPAFYIYGGVPKQLTPLAGSAPSLIRGKSEFILNLAVKDQIQRCSLPECSKIIGVNPRTLRPANYNGTFRVLVQGVNDKNVLLVQIDNRGNIFRINVSNRRSKKEVLLLTDKQGVR